MSFEINTELNEAQLKELQSSLNNNEIIIIKFSAEWCAPCQGIKHICEDYVNQFNSKVHYYNIDIDESLDLYIKFKSLKQVNGIPAILCFHAKDRDYWYCPDDSCLGADKKMLTAFFERCLKIIN